MGRRATVEELLARAESKDSKRGAHAECDPVRNREKHVKKPRKDQDKTVRRYVLHIISSPRVPFIVLKLSCSQHSLTKWHLPVMQRDAAKYRRPLPSEEMAYKHYLRPSITTPDLVTSSGFYYQH